MPQTRTVLDAPGRMIFGLMIFTMTFSLVGGEIAEGQGQKAPVSPFTIIFGGTVATSLLTLLSHAGEAGERFAVGLATVAFSTSALVYGKPVWDRLNEAFGAQPGAQSTKSTTSTLATSDAGTPTNIATAQAVPVVTNAFITS